LRHFRKNWKKLLKLTQVFPQILPKRNWYRDRYGQFAVYAFTIGNRSMRFWTWSSGFGVLMIAFLIATRSAVAQAPSAEENVRPIESAKTTGFSFDRFASPIGATKSTTDQTITTVAVPPRKSINFQRASMFRPKAPNIHTRPKKKKTSWWPFGKK
jgi:hypothetical protein